MQLTQKRGDCFRANVFAREGPRRGACESEPPDSTAVDEVGESVHSRRTGGDEAEPHTGWTWRLSMFGGDARAIPVSDGPAEHYFGAKMFSGSSWTSILGVDDSCPDRAPPSRGVIRLRRGNSRTHPLSCTEPACRAVLSPMRSGQPILHGAPSEPGSQSRISHRDYCTPWRLRGCGSRRPEGGDFDVSPR